MHFFFFFHFLVDQNFSWKTSLVKKRIDSIYSLINKMLYGSAPLKPVAPPKVCVSQTTGYNGPQAYTYSFVSIKWFFFSYYAHVNFITDDRVNFESVPSIFDSPAIRSTWNFACTGISHDNRRKTFESVECHWFWLVLTCCRSFPDEPYT